MIKDKFLTNSKQRIKNTKNESKYSFLEDEKSFLLIFHNSPHPIFLRDKKK